VPGCRSDADCAAAVPASYCDGGAGQCRCLPGFVAGRSANASCARIAAAATCRSDADCSDAIPDSHCDSAGRCQCDVLRVADANGTACVLRPLGGFCRQSADCLAALPDTQCGAAARCECVSGFRAVDDGTACARRRVGSPCSVTSDCAASMNGSECVDGACACRVEYAPQHGGGQDGGGGCVRRRLDDAACGGDADCEAWFGAGSRCARRRCACARGRRPDPLRRSSCVPRRRLDDPWPCRDHADCRAAVAHSRCDPVARRCACAPGYRPTAAAAAAAGNASGDTCRRRAIGDRCATAEDCSAAVARSTCGDAGRCACAPGYGTVTDGSGSSGARWQECRRRRVGDGEVGCTQDRECAEAIESSRCRGGRCACLAGHRDVDNATRCRSRKHSTNRPVHRTRTQSCPWVHFV